MVHGIFKHGPEPDLDRNFILCNFNLRSLEHDPPKVKANQSRLSHHAKLQNKFCRIHLIHLFCDFNNIGNQFDADLKFLRSTRKIHPSPIRPKNILVILSGRKPYQKVNMIVNKRTVMSMDQLIQDVSKSLGRPKVFISYSSFFTFPSGFYFDSESLPIVILVEE